MLADVWTSFWIWPVYILAFLLIVLVVFVVLGRIKGGKYLRPIVMAMTKVPFLRKGMMKASESAMRKQNPELASAIKKMERSGAMNDPMRAQQAMSRLSGAERRAPGRPLAVVHHPDVRLRVAADPALDHERREHPRHDVGAVLR